MRCLLLAASVLFYAAIIAPTRAADISKVISYQVDYTSGCSGDVNNIKYYPQDGNCYQTEGPNDAHRRRRRDDSGSRRRREGQSYRATATKLEKWAQVDTVWNSTSNSWITTPGSSTCSGTPAVTYTVNSCGEGENRRRRRRGGTPEPSFAMEAEQYTANVQPGDELFTYKAYEDQNCNLQGTPPTSGNMYGWGAARGGCTAKKQNNHQSHRRRGVYQLSYEVEEWSSGGNPNIAGPFIKVSIWANVSGSTDNCSAATPDSIKYYPSSTSGNCIRTGEGTSVKVTSTASGGRISTYGRRRTSSDCGVTDNVGAAPTGEIYSAASWISPPPPPAQAYYTVEFGINSASQNTWLDGSYVCPYTSGSSTLGLSPQQTDGVCWSAYNATCCWGAIRNASQYTADTKAVYEAAWLAAMGMTLTPGVTVESSVRSPPNDHCGTTSTNAVLVLTLRYPLANTTIKNHLMQHQNRPNAASVVNNMNTSRASLGKSSTVVVPSNMCGPSNEDCGDTCCSCSLEQTGTTREAIPENTCRQDLVSTTIDGDGGGYSRSVKVEYFASDMTIAANQWVNSKWYSSNVGNCTTWTASGCVWPSQYDSKWACGQVSTCLPQFTA